MMEDECPAQWRASVNGHLPIEQTLITNGARTSVTAIAEATDSCVVAGIAGRDRGLGAKLDKMEAENKVKGWTQRR